MFELIRLCTDFDKKLYECISWRHKFTIDQIWPVTFMRGFVIFYFKTFWPNYNIDLRSYGQLLLATVRACILDKANTMQWMAPQINICATLSFIVYIWYLIYTPFFWIGVIIQNIKSAFFIIQLFLIHFLTLKVFITIRDNVLRCRELIHFIHIFV